ARAGGGPTLLVCESYRHEGHYYGDPRKYQTKEEIEGWKTTFDPLIDARAWIVREKLGTEAELDAIDRGIDDAIEQAVAWAEAGPSRSLQSPRSGIGLVGTAVGAALPGMRPVAELMYIDFSGLAIDQIVNQAAQNRFMFGGQARVPLVVRTQGGSGRGNAAQ